jgi:hypothetical protein
MYKALQMFSHALQHHTMSSSHPAPKQVTDTAPAEGVAHSFRVFSLLPTVAQGLRARDL